MAKLSVNPSKIEMVKKTLSVAAPTGGVMGAAKQTMEGPNPTKEELAKGVAIQSTRIPKVEDETEGLVKIGSALFKKDDVEAMLPQLKKVFAKGAEGDNGYAFDDVQNIISALSGKPVTSSYTVDKDKYNKTNVKRNLWDVGNSGYAHKIMGYLRRAGLGQ